jgi:hypothetical protein
LFTAKDRVPESVRERTGENPQELAERHHAAYLLRQAGAMGK